MVSLCIGLGPAIPLADAAAPAAIIYCKRCHGENGISPNDLWPNLAGQNAEYLRSQLAAFQSGARRDALMQDWANLLSPEELEAVVVYYATLSRNGSEPARSASTPGASKHVGQTLPLATSAQDAKAAPPSRHTVPAWYLGMPVVMRGTSRYPPASLSEVQVAKLREPTMRVYIVAPASPGMGASPAQNVVVRGRRVVLPEHQAVLRQLSSPDEHRIAVGYFVSRGPRANPRTVRWQEQPDQAWPAAPLVSAIRIGTEWVPLTSHVAIEYGLARGLLALEYFDAGDEQWATLDWDEYLYRPELTASCPLPSGSRQ